MELLNYKGEEYYLKLREKFIDGKTYCEMLFFSTNGKVELTLTDILPDYIQEVRNKSLGQPKTRDNSNYVEFIISRNSFYVKSEYSDMFVSLITQLKGYIHEIKRQVLVDSQNSYDIFLIRNIDDFVSDVDNDAVHWIKRCNNEVQKYCREALSNYYFCINEDEIANLRKQIKSKYNLNKIKLNSNLTVDDFLNAGFTNYYEPTLFFNRIIAGKGNYTDSLLIEVGKKTLKLEEIGILDDSFCQPSPLNDLFEGRKKNPSNKYQEDAIKNVDKYIDELIEKGILIYKESNN